MFLLSRKKGTSKEKRVAISRRANISGKRRFNIAAHGMKIRGESCERGLSCEGREVENGVGDGKGGGKGRRNKKYILVMENQRVYIGRKFC